MGNKSDVLYSIENKVAIITINQAAKRNRLSYPMMRTIVDFVDEADKDDNVKVVVITGEGTDAFCSGADIGQFEADDIQVSRDTLLDAYTQLSLVWARLGKPSIAKICGYALAGGCGLAMFPTFSIAAENAVFGLPEIKVGTWPMIVMATLFRIVGRKKGLEMCCTGDFIDAREAERIGMVNKVVPLDKIDDEVTMRCEKLKSLSASSLRFGLGAFYTMSDMEYSTAIKYLKEMATILTKTKDTVEGTRAFMEKRQPRWER
ncbi:MAG: enoyl-CoA hydratase/isomerase family protein [Smithellaceae bacterium]|jgi:enoyl-CoA hydratase/carnithine racemase